MKNITFCFWMWYRINKRKSYDFLFFYLLCLLFVFRRQANNIWQQTKKNTLNNFGKICYTHQKYIVEFVYNTFKISQFQTTQFIYSLFFLLSTLWSSGERDHSRVFLFLFVYIENNWRKWLSTWCNGVHIYIWVYSRTKNKRKITTTKQC